MIGALPLTHPVIMGQGQVGRCSGANSCHRLVAVSTSGCSGLVGRGRALRHSSALPTVSGAGRWCAGRRCWAVLGALGLLAGVGVGSWLLGQCWDLQWLGEGQRMDSGGAGREEQEVSGCLGQVG